MNMNMNDTIILRRCKYVLVGIYVLLGAVLGAQSNPGSFAFVPDNPLPGEFVTIGASGDSGAKAAVLVSEGGEKLSRATFFSQPDAGFLAAVLAIPSTAAPGKATVRIEGAQGIIGELALNIAKREFVSETIELNASLTGIRTDASPQRVSESDQLWVLLNRTGSEVYFSGKFTSPVASTRRTSHFGSRRVFQHANGNSDVSIHAGVDYGVPTGTSVLAPAAGKVVLAKQRIVTGNSVVLEHLPGVYSLYYHLDSIAVAEGDLVEAGTLLGLSGATGLATGPHLHWEIRVFGENADPDAFMARPMLDKDAIMSKLKS
jgi:murein DD-endopeptidase MepM/ murein hydrolase activator NlpD